MAVPKSTQKPRADSEVLRMFRKIRFTPDCWIWTASCKNGYGGMSVGGHYRQAHRVLYEWFYGVVDRGLELDHLCRNRACVNPNHLEPVTRSENIRRAFHPLVRTKCKRGHSYIGSNVAYDKRGFRYCVTCHSLAAKRLNAKWNAFYASRKKAAQV